MPFESRLAAIVALLSSAVVAQAPISDPGIYGPKLEIAHLYYGQWPTGVTVANDGRMFSTFPAGLDGNNTYTGGAIKYQVAQLMPNGSEVPYPSTEINSPPGGAINRTTTPPTSVNYQDYLIGVQSVVIDSNNTLWCLDTGRAIDPTSQLLTNAQVGGPKLVGIDLSTNKVSRTITFPPTVVYADSYLNDVRFDNRPNLSHVNSSGVAYITDSSDEGRTGLIVVDLESGNSWRHLNTDPRAKPDLQFVPFIWGQPVYAYDVTSKQATYVMFGADGITLSADGETLYFDSLASRYLHSIPTVNLRMQGPASEILAQASVRTIQQKGVSDGFETDTNGNIYMGSTESNAIVIWNEKVGMIKTFVVDPRISWVDTMSVANGELYFTANQFALTPTMYPGTDRRKHPYVLFKAPLPNGGTRVVYAPKGTAHGVSNGTTSAGGNMTSYKW